MGKEKMVIVGAIAAGGSAAFKLKRLNPRSKVQVFEAGDYFSYAACGIPYYLSGIIGDYRDMIMRNEKDFQEGAGIELYTAHRVQGIDLSRREVVVRDLKRGKEKKYGFDKLLLATGALPVIPPVEGVELKGVVALRTLEDGLKLKELLLEKDCRRVVIIGGGYIGLELAEAMRALNKEVCIIEKLPQVMASLDDDMAALLEQELKGQGVVVRKEESLVSFKGDEAGRLKEVVSDKNTYKADLAILALGVRPASDLAKEAGIRLGEKKAISVNEYLETSAPGVFAAGDCAEVYHRLLQRNVYLPLGTTANRQGRLAAENMCGAGKKFAGVLGSAVVKVFDLSAARTGLSIKEARENGIAADAITVKALDNAPYYPGGRFVCVKLVYHASSGKLLGGQVVGSVRAVKRVDVLATAITAGLTVEELGEVDMAYAPPFAEVWDCLAVAANVASGKRANTHSKKGKKENFLKERSQCGFEH